MGRNQQPKSGGYAGNKGNKPTASEGKGGGGNKKTVDAATALGLGVPQQTTMLLGLAGLGMVQQNPLDLLFGSVGANNMAGLGGVNTSLQSADSGNDLGMISFNLQPYWGARSSNLSRFSLLSSYMYGKRLHNNMQRRPRHSNQKYRNESRQRQLHERRSL